MQSPGVSFEALSPSPRCVNMMDVHEALPVKRPPRLFGPPTTCKECGTEHRSTASCPNPKCIERARAKKASKKRKAPLPPSPLPAARKRKDIAVDFFLGLELIENAFKDLYEHVGDELRKENLSDTK